ncbi:unnamed protein product [Colias eurytheme]|nr:unnamed protein product [Colias eurytheme]
MAIYSLGVTGQRPDRPLDALEGIICVLQNAEYASASVFLKQLQITEGFGPWMRGRDDLATIIHCNVGTAVLNGFKRENGVVSQGRHVLTNKASLVV